MAWRPHGRARVNAKQPRAFAICDRCGILYNHVDLSWQLDWRGNKITNIRLLVCKHCYDKPYEGNRPLKLPPDPLPIKDARPVQYSIDEQNVPSAVLWDEPGILWDDGQTDYDNS
jgi:hypothetical protein